MTRSNHAFQKRLRERLKREKRAEKERKRAERKAAKANSPDATDGPAPGDQGEQDDVVGEDGAARADRPDENEKS
ncbi:MAG TPA: hypothetical protein VK081_04340 [Planctomycetota bacterium]|nr:hypothetical protein [Planctomycetota bacterium]